MDDVNELISKKLEEFPPHVRQLALTAIRHAENGMTETSISELLNNTIKQIYKKKGVGK